MLIEGLLGAVVYYGGQIIQNPTFQRNMAYVLSKAFAESEVGKKMDKAINDSVQKVDETIRKSRRDAWNEERSKCANRTCQAGVCGFKECPRSDKYSCRYVKDAIKAAGLDKEPIYS